MTVIELSVRRKDTEVADRVRGDATRLHQRHRSAVVLIHGYDVDLQSARKIYSAWHRSLSHSFLGGVWPATHDVYGFHWPGSIEPRTSWWDRVKSKSSFGNRIAVAAASGRRLGELLRTSAVSDVTLVAHSLGNRVALSALRSAKPLERIGPLPRIRRVVMMAAAVAEGDCHEPPAGVRDIDDLPDTDDLPLFSRPILPAETEYWNLYSHNDAVLGIAFPVEASRDGQKHPVAIGYSGGPRDRWDETRHLGLLHDQYWRDSFSQSVAAAAVQPRFVRVQPPARPLGARSLMPPRPGPPHRDLPS